MFSMFGRYFVIFRHAHNPQQPMSPVTYAVSRVSILFKRRLSNQYNIFVSVGGSEGIHFDVHVYFYVLYFGYQGFINLSLLLLIKTCWVCEIRMTYLFLANK